MVNLGDLVTVKSKDPFKPGTIIFIEDYRFKNGNVRDKYFVILGRNLNKEILLVITTSKKNHRQDTLGCDNHSEYFVDKKYSKKGKTIWVLFGAGEIYPYSAENLLKYKSKIDNTISDVDFKSLINCFKKSEDFRGEYNDFLKN